MTKVDSVDQSLALARAALAPPARVKGRVRNALMAASPSATPLPAGAGRLTAWKGLGLLGAGLVAGYLLGQQRRAPDFAPSRAPLAVADSAAVTAPEDAARPSRHAAPEPPSAPPSDEASARPEDEDDRRELGTPKRRTPQKAAPKPSVASRAADARSAELLLLARAERAIRAGEGALALSLVSELDERHPRSRFGEERSAMRVLAECLLHEPPARVRAEAFLEEKPTSVYSERVRKLCGLEGTSTDKEPPVGNGPSGREH